MCKWRPEDNFTEWILSFNYVGLKDWTQVIFLGGKCLCLLSHLSILVLNLHLSPHIFPVSIFRLPIGCGSHGRSCEASQQRSERLSTWTYLYFLDSDVRTIILLWGSEVCSSHGNTWQSNYTCVTSSGFSLSCERPCWEFPWRRTISSKMWLDKTCETKTTDPWDLQLSIIS